MRRISWQVAGFMLIMSTIFVVADLDRGSSWSAVLVGVVAALALCVGTWYAPTTLTAPPPEPVEHRRRKEWQFVIAGGVAAVAAWIFDGNPGMAAMVGIIAAIFVGALLPRQNAVRDGQR